MPRQFVRTLLLLGPVVLCPAAFAQGQAYQPAVLHPQAQAQSYAPQQASNIRLANETEDDAGADPVEPEAIAPNGEGMYPILNAPLYPCPRPNIPTGVGMTTITNPALNPHEMLYPHRNTGLYGPFYHKTTRGWVLTPLGVYRREKRVLTGTTVDVKYKGHISPFALFSPPIH